MLCPECQDPLVIVECDHVELDVCIRQHGLWFDADELRQLFDLAGVDGALASLEQRLEPAPAGSGVRRRCPRCRRKMKHVRAPGVQGAVVLDECPNGHGLWFDEGELHDVLSVELEASDVALVTIKGYLGSFSEPGDKESTDD